MNPNSTNPYFKKQMTSPELHEEKNFESRPLRKQNTGINEARKKVHDLQHQKSADLGNGFIRGGIGLARTPPRSRPQYSPIEGDEGVNDSFEEEKSGLKDNSRSPVDNMEEHHNR